MIVVSNFDAQDGFGFELQLPPDIIKAWELMKGSYVLVDQLSDHTCELQVHEGYAKFRIDLKTLQSFILQIK